MPKMKKLFKEVSNSYNMAELEATLTEVKSYDRDISECCCEDALNNISESYNYAIDKAPTLSLVEMLEIIRRQTMLRINMRKQKAMKYMGKYNARVDQIIILEEKGRQNCRVVLSCRNQFKVIEHCSPFQVDTNTRTCTCRRWDLTGIPCRHALGVILYKQWRVEDFVAHWYLTSTWQNIYNVSIKTLNGMQFWKTSGEPRIQAPLRVISLCRKKKPQKRIKGVNESPTKDKKSYKGCLDNSLW